MESSSSENSQMHLIKQGAEARIFKGNFCGKPCIIKERFKKKYRHPVLEERLAKQRLNQECKSLLRCRRAGIATPAVYFVDTRKNSIYLEDVEDSITVRDYLYQLQETLPAIFDTPSEKHKTLAQKIGSTLGLLHSIDLIHGDLTTSNILLRSPPDDSPVLLIDFGLSQVSHLQEDKGVDLYVLEKAFLSTHPNTEAVFQEVLDSYKKSYKRSPEVIKKLDEVRMRGRKRVMIG